MRRAVHMIALVAACGATSCAAMQPRSELFKEIGASKVSPAVLRIEVRGMAPRFMGLLEAMADEVTHRSPDVPTRAAMTRFKMNALPSMQSALYQPDPVAALIDAWALLVQVENAIASHPAAADPELATYARERVRLMEDEILAVWRRLTGRDGTEARRRVRAWADEHRLKDGLAARQSTAGLLASMTARAGVRPLSAAASLLEDTRDVAARIDLLVAFLPKLARWQVELVVYEALTDPGVAPALSQARELADAAQALSRLGLEVPDIIEQQRKRVFEEIEEERRALQAFVAGERQAIEAMIDRQRTLAVEEGEATGLRLMDQGTDRVTSVMNGLLLRGIAFAGACAGLVLVVRFLWLRM